MQLLRVQSQAFHKENDFLKVLPEKTIGFAAYTSTVLPMVLIFYGNSGLCACVCSESAICDMQGICFGLK